jgi:hypothetical protein
MIALIKTEREFAAVATRLGEQAYDDFIGDRVSEGFEKELRPIVSPLDWIMRSRFGDGYGVELVVADGIIVPGAIEAAIVFNRPDGSSHNVELLGTYDEEGFTYSFYGKFLNLEDVREVDARLSIIHLLSLEAEAHVASVEPIRRPVQAQTLA